MNTKDNYYSPEEIRMFDLIEYHKNHLLAKVEEGTDDVETFQKLHCLEQMKDLVKQRACQRDEREQKEIADKQEDLKKRSVDECPECEKRVPVTIIGEEIYEETGLLYDIVVCSVCQSEFAGSVPNNHNDRVKHFENLKAFLLTVQENGETIAETIYGKEGAEKELAKIDAYNLSHLKVLESEVAAEGARKTQEEAFASMYNMLLAGKLGVYNLNTPEILS